MLVSELKTHIYDIHPSSSYYNDQCGDVSAIIAALLSEELQKKDDWNSEINWVDDSLLNKVEVQDHKCKIWGVMIWGTNNSTEQWTDPFYFETDLTPVDSALPCFVFLFGDRTRESVPYTVFKDHRDTWNEDFYGNPRWDVSERDWKYILYS